jgi:hypothetical protein
MRNAEEEDEHAAYMDVILLAGAHNLAFFFFFQFSELNLKKAAVRGPADSAL